MHHTPRTRATLAAWAALQLLGAAPALAQTPATAPPTPPAQSGAPQADLGTLLQSARQVAQLIDAGQAATLWANASPAVRPQLSTAQFVAGLQKRLALGQAHSRKWVQTQLINITPGRGTPPGHYASVEFTATFGSGHTLRELVSLRQDEDQTWRFVGYANPD